MPSRKRGLAEVEAESSPPAAPQAPGLLKRLRNSWVFACSMQFIYIFGDVFKIDTNFDIEDLEEECLKAGHRPKLAEIGLCLLKSISSQRGLTSNDFDEYTSRQYKRRLPDTPNPFGDGDEPLKFLDFDVFTQLRILHQLSLWTLLHPDRIREKMDKGDRDVDWRIDVIGWDRDDRSYYLLDDSRLYRRTDPAVKVAAKPKPKPKPKPKAKPPPKVKPARQGTRASKRLKMESEEPLSEVDEEVLAESVHEDDAEPANDPESDLGDGYLWENVAITLGDYEAFLGSMQKSRDPNERNLHRHLTQEVLPQIQKAEENRQKKIAQRERELLNMEKLAHAKRSSRIAGKVEREQKEAETRAAEDKHQRDLAAAKAEALRQKQLEEARESRMMTREQRIKEREYKRILHEEELANLSKATEAMEAGEAKLSERRLKADMARKQKELEELQQDEDWMFDCAKCGVYGENIDDGTPSIACERCSVWQHCACLGFSPEEADKDDFHFICDTCERREREEKQREEDAKKPKLPPIKFYVPPTDDTETPPKRKRGRPRKQPLPEGEAPPTATNGISKEPRRESDAETTPGMPPMKKFKAPPKQPQMGMFSAPSAPAPPSASIPATPNGYQSMRYTFMNGPTLSPKGQINHPQAANGATHPPPGLMSPPGPPSVLPSRQYASPYGQAHELGRPVAPPTADRSHTNGHSPVKPVPLSPAVGSSPSLNNIPSPMIQPPKKDMQAAGLSPTKHSPKAPPAALFTPSPFRAAPMPTSKPPASMNANPMPRPDGILASPAPQPLQANLLHTQPAAQSATAPSSASGLHKDAQIAEVPKPFNQSATVVNGQASPPAVGAQVAQDNSNILSEQNTNDAPKAGLPPPPFPTQATRVE